MLIYTCSRKSCSLHGEKSALLTHALDTIPTFFFIKFGVGPVVSMDWHGLCVSAHGAAMQCIRYAFPQYMRVQTRQSSAKILSRRSGNLFYARPHCHMQCDLRWLILCSCRNFSFFPIHDSVQVASNFHEYGHVYGVEVFRHCSAVSAHGSAVRKHSVSSAWLLCARKRMSRVSPLTLRVQCHI